MNQILRNTGAVLSQTFYTDEDPVAADGAVTVTVMRADGTTVSTGSATLDDTEYTYSLAPQANLGLLTVTWAGAFGGVSQSLTTTVEIVGGFYVALAEIRALPGLADSGKYPTADLIKARHWFETRFENHVGTAFVSRATEEWVDGSGDYMVQLGHWPVTAVSSIREYSSATVYTSYAQAALDDIRVGAGGAIRRVSLGYFPSGTRNLRVTYTYGFTPTPVDVKDACLIAIREKLLEDASGARGNRQFSVATEAGVVRSSVPGDARPFGIPAVDAVANSYRSRFRSRVGSVRIASPTAVA